MQLGWTLDEGLSLCSGPRTEVEPDEGGEQVFRAELAEVDPLREQAIDLVLRDDLDESVGDHQDKQRSGPDREHGSHVLKQSWSGLARFFPSGI